MKLKRVISLLLLAVYLFATSLSAYASLSCHCVSMEVVAEHVCCSHCQTHDDSIATDEESLWAPCCSDAHSTDIVLYTSDASDAHKSARTRYFDLPVALAAPMGWATTELGPITCEKITERPTPFVRQAPLLPSGLRAPPVLV